MKEKKTMVRIAGICLFCLLMAGCLAGIISSFAEQGEDGWSTYLWAAGEAPPRIKLKLVPDETEKVAFAGIDIAVLEETDTVESDPEDLNADMKVFKPKEGTPRRILTRSTSITADPGRIELYEAGVRYKLMMRTLYVALEDKNARIIIAEQDNGKDGWVVIPGSEFMISFFPEFIEGDSFVRHTDRWDENRTRYNESKAELWGLDETQEVRPYNTFWSGEKLLLHVVTTQIAGGEADDAVQDDSGIEVRLFEEIDGEWQMPFEPVLLEEAELIEEDGEQHEEGDGAQAHEDAGKRYLYQGVMWSEQMIFRWGSSRPEKIRITVVPVVGGERITRDEREEEIIMDDGDLFFQIHRVKAR